MYAVKHVVLSISEPSKDVAHESCNIVHGVLRSIVTKYIAYRVLCKQPHMHVRMSPLTLETRHIAKEMTGDYVVRSPDARRGIKRSEY